MAVNSKVNTWVIGILCMIIGAFIGVGFVHLTISGTVSAHNILIKQNDEGITDNKEMIQAIMNLNTELVNQNNLLIQKIMLKP